MKRSKMQMLSTPLLTDYAHLDQRPSMSQAYYPRIVTSTYEMTSTRSRDRCNSQGQSQYREEQVGSKQP